MKEQFNNRDGYEFMPAHLEILQRPPAPLARVTAFMIAALVVIAVVWSILGHLDIHANATGKIIVSSRSKIVQSLESGEIASINVREGQTVKAGELLLSLNPIGAKAEVGRLQEQLSSNLIEVARLNALLSDSPIENFSLSGDFTKQDILQAREYLLSEWEERLAQLSSIEHEVTVNRTQVKKANEEIRSITLLINNIDQRLQAQRTLEKNRLLPKVSLLEQEQVKLEKSQQLVSLQGEVAVLNAQHASLLEKKHNLVTQEKRKNREKLSQIRSQVAVLKQDLIKAREKQRLQNIYAPVDGVVQQMTTHTLSGVVQPAQQLMVIVPIHSALEAEVNILNKDVGFIRNGQDVEVKIDAYPYTRYGTIKGKVVHVSRDSVKDEQIGLVFPTQIKLASSALVNDGEGLELQPGMSVVAEITTGDRRIIDYLLSPLREYKAEAMRER